MASITNKSLNTGSITNKAIMAESTNPTFEETRPATFSQILGPFDSAIAIGLVNKSANTASITNQPIS